MASECGNIIQISFILNSSFKPGTCSAKKLTQMVEQFSPISILFLEASPSYFTRGLYSKMGEMRHKGQIHLTGTFAKARSSTLCTHYSTDYHVRP